MRIAFGGIHTECSTYNPVLNYADDFRILRGDELTASPYFAFLADYDALFLPTFHARAIAGGPVARVTYEDFKQDFLSRLATLLPVDGVYLAMHGAVYVEGMEDAEGDWIAATRELVGDDCPISVSYDLHGNVTQRIIDAIDMFSTYRTAPHIDVEETMRRSVAMLVKSLHSGVKPGVVWAPIPVVLPGERTSTEDEPAKSLYARLPAINAIDHIWDASLMVGYVWADEPRATAAAIMTGTDADVLAEQAAKLALAYWQAREQFSFGCVTGSTEECVRMAIASPTHPVILADSGDNPTGGGVGDRGDMLAELIRQGAQGVIVAGITDKPATDAAFAAGVGATLPLTLGATLDPAGGKASAQFVVTNLVDDARSVAKQALLQTGGITVVVADRRRPYHNLADFALLGLDPATANIVVVKSGYLSPELAPLANPNLMALSEGVVDQYVERLVRKRKTQPAYPFDTDFDFLPVSTLSARFMADPQR
ncbi:M81 family metallopeptidase [Pantoea cypripedii]|uniref:Microcystinase C n=1 Tax=Pantoea cypripedii TaxID=55209 RepID=A0A1X1EFR0_PANCY|nr:M81 family metallopeptidase [Pantoea cypripedii]MBP2199365.1 microcystin degradation protein MlrC [Pantoea cypripedii]ORM87788.1 microcystin degradation protein MlrC [Pantoea cypripedii]